MLDLEEFLQENLGYGCRHDDFVLEVEELRSRQAEKRRIPKVLHKQKRVVLPKYNPLRHRALRTQGSKGKWTLFAGRWMKL
jgi:hypothetical protein